ncbi:MAG: TetR/AcrR family transcriptional regulator [Deltaproteobacteria bacterium]|nr:TetR/AcrR family transcriptional regulator [Deltaproteobacteria bacterium]
MEPAERREQILIHAARLFAERGYHSTSVADIIAAAGIARGTFYLYFESKRAIFEELLDRLMTRLASCIRRVDVSDGAPPPGEQLLCTMARVFDVFAADRTMLAILLSGAVGLDKGFDDKLAEFYGRVALVVERSLELGEELGIVRPCNRRVVARAAIGALKEVLATMLEDGDASCAELARGILDLFSRGVLVEGASIA